MEDSSQESSRVSRSRQEGRKMITTRIIRKTTTLTRGEEQTVSESLTRSSGGMVNVVPIGGASHYPAIQSKRAKVRQKLPDFETGRGRRTYRRIRTFGGRNSVLPFLPRSCVSGGCHRFG
ncbi:UNVERIFIED_CONTAM: hypothetical protein PYX00_004654 [Menopon gallinae]|uniref:Uncharacterized protein n=1 Tax=Menopon gallinae TaxID=328185 RepID=A0AAW2I507_9NEOP